MALQESEGTARETLDLMKLPGGAKTGYIMIGRCDIDYTAKTFTALILSFASEEARQEDIQNAHPYFIGGALTDEEIERMKADDDRSVIYPAVERLLHEHSEDGARTLG